MEPVTTQGPKQITPDDVGLVAQAISMADCQVLIDEGYADGEVSMAAVLQPIIDLRDAALLICANPEPEGSCSSSTHNGHTYWYCTDDQTWAAADTVCRVAHMDLVRIDDATENTFVTALMANNWNAWIGANDIVTETDWSWSRWGSQFWEGESGGSSVGGLFESWQSGNPASQGDDCAYINRNDSNSSIDEMWTSWACTATRDYVCETLG